MNHRCLASASAVSVLSVILLWAPAPIAGQALSGAKASAAVKAAPAAKTWTPSRTPDGQPDLQGFWTNNTVTPMERPKGLGAKEFYTEQEMAENAKQEEARAKVAVLGRGTEPGTAEDVHYDFSQFGLDRGQSKVAWNRRTSLIVGPEGTVPKLLPEAQKRAADRAAINRGHQFDAAENRPLSERCILLAQEAVPMLPGGYNNNLQIVQGQGYVAIVHEMNHAVRVIPTDGRPHAPQSVRQLRGDPRGHWEGNTLVVDVTNFTDRNPFRGSSDKLHVVERFTPVDNDTILYQFTVEDPATWDKPWTVELVMSKVQGPIYEFACQEGNYGMRNTLHGARVADDEAALKK